MNGASMHSVDTVNMPSEDVFFLTILGSKNLPHAFSYSYWLGALQGLWMAGTATPQNGFFVSRCSTITDITTKMDILLCFFSHQDFAPGKSAPWYLHYLIIGWVMGAIDLSGSKHVNTIIPISVRMLTHHQRQPVDKSPALSIQVLNPRSISSPAPVYIVVSDLICVVLGLGHHIALRMDWA